MAVLPAAVAAVTVLIMANVSAGFSNAAQQLDCDAVVKQVVGETGGRLLSVRVHGGQCAVSILVQRDNTRPRKVIIRADPTRELTNGRPDL